MDKMIYSWSVKWWRSKLCLIQFMILSEETILNDCRDKSIDEVLLINSLMAKIAISRWECAGAREKSISWRDVLCKSGWGEDSPLRSLLQGNQTVDRQWASQREIKIMCDHLIGIVLIATYHARGSGIARWSQFANNLTDCRVLNKSISALVLLKERTETWLLTKCLSFSFQDMLDEHQIKSKWDY